MGSSGEDSPPLVARLQRATARASTAGVLPEGTQPPACRQPASDEDDLPAWAQSYKSPYRGGYKPALPSSSEDDLIDLTKTSQPDEPGQDGLSKAAASTRKLGQQPSSIEGGKKAGRGRQRGKAGGLPALDMSQQQDTPMPMAIGDLTDDMMAVPGTQGDKELGSADNAGTQPQTQPQGTAAGGPSVKLKGTPVGRGTAALQAALQQGGELPVMLPEKLLRNKALVELAATARDEEAVDLAGDAGAVGRLLVTGKSGCEEMTIDLKGVLFRAAILPLQGTVMVLNIQTSEARVEAVFNNFVRLVELRGQFDEAEGEGLGSGLDSDDEHYGGAQGDGADVEGAEGKTKPKKKVGASSSKNKKPKTSGKSKSRGGRAGGVKTGGVKKPKPGGKKPGTGGASAKRGGAASAKKGGAASAKKAGAASGKK